MKRTPPTVATSAMRCGGVAKVCKPWTMASGPQSQSAAARMPAAAFCRLTEECSRVSPRSYSSARPSRRR